MRPSTPHPSHPASETITTQIPLKRRDGKTVAYALVDANDAPPLIDRTWRLSTHGYAVRSETRDGKKRTIYLHREILKVAAGSLVDHVNGDRLDNRRQNLRVATPGENAANSRDRPRRSGYRGVYPHKPTGRWIAQISAGGQVRHLGIYDDPEVAARAYDLAALGQWGQFARTSGFA